jgi:hypothetical protein
MQSEVGSRKSELTHYLPLTTHYSLFTNLEIYSYATELDR